ncbi:hypothetical protein [uncultured Methylobacterium sp.]|uniref:hypothetical protein n=1 Tax=uncultured Methylobacterium sp. TaxID=157278 RepID=UPI0035C9570C
MTVSRPSPALLPAPAAEAAPAAARSGFVLPFAPAASPRRRPEPGEARGEILLFLGVRYERRAS